MVNPFRTLRFRLVLLNLAVFGSILVVLGLVVLFVAERFLRQEFDRRLIDGAQSMVEAMEIVAEEAPDEVRESHFRPHLNPFHFLEYHFQIRNRDGRLIERSANLRTTSLPLSDAAREARTKGTAVLETLAEETAARLLGKGHQLRLLTLYHERTGMPPFYLQVGVSLTSVDHAVAALRRTMVLLIPIGLLLAALASERVVRRTLAPIGRVAREAQQLTATRLERRLPVPAGRDEVVEMIHTLNDMLDRLQAAFAAQERFVANAAHELKTPVTHLLGQAQVLARQVRQPEEYDRFVSAVQEEMRHLAMIVESLLLLARADAGLPLEGRAQVSINEVVTDAVERCHPYAAQREVRLEPMLCAPTTEEDEPEVEGDAELLVSMLINLVRNAIRFSPPGECVEIEVRRADGQVCVAVRDRGPGIAVDQLPRLFERFHQAPSDGRSTGAGLGLSIAQAVAKLHRGRLVVDNQPDGGCVFTAGLPLSPKNLTTASRAE
jgi:two-component system OmpR family sensor kinase